MKLANSICLFICCFIPSLVPSLGASLIILLSSCPLKHHTIPLLTIWKEQQPILPQKFQSKPRHSYPATALGMFQIPLIPPRNNSHHAPSTFPSSQLVFLSCTHFQLRAVVMIFKIIGLMLGKKIYSIAIETPIVFGLCIVRLIIDSAHHICSRNPPAVVFVIPDSHHLAVINMYILFTHN